MSGSAANQWKIRPAEAGDVAFLFATWKQSFWRDSPWAKRLRWGIFAPNHDKVIRKILARAQVFVACEPEHQDEIAGYFVFELAPLPCAHFAYVKPAFRRDGVFTQLIAASGLPPDLAGVHVTHGTKAWFSIPAVVDRPSGTVVKEERPGIEQKYPQAIHNPYVWLEP